MSAAYARPHTLGVFSDNGAADHIVRVGLRLLLIGGEHFGEIKGFQGERLLAPVLFAQTRIRS